MDQPKNQAKQPQGWRVALLHLLACITKLWARTLRIKVDANAMSQLKAETPTIFILWHNRLFVISEIYRRFRRVPHRKMYGLISRSKDGGWLAFFFRLMGIHAIRGSSSKGAVQALRSLVGVAKAGHDIGITPDGPRGPSYKFQPGALLLLKKSEAKLVVFGFKIHHAKRLASWDRFYIPWPFSRIDVSAQAFEDYDALMQSLPKGQKPDAFLEAQLKAMNPD